ncbi:MAG TPA: peptide ABC transporter ATP-binding protein [Clostridiales bacterium]|jgi:oligopeptide transport system ATP-binding protein|nr:peptide ABC transporter ATP-binding protein [Clostridiales bacterium]
MENKNLLEVKNLKQYFDIPIGLLRSKPLKAVDDISFSIRKGETLGLVGESGCGKTTVGRSILQLYKPTSGEVIFKGQKIESKGSIKHLRQNAQMVFQDPYSSLNPRMTVGDIVGEPLDVMNMYKNRKERDNRVNELMEIVGLSSEHATRYAHEFSGGQRQRIGIARALAVEPEFIVCDEPVSALDVSIQAQIINKFEDLQAQLGLTYLFIAHDILVVKHISNRIAVMYLGRMMELAPADELYNHPLHPYTISLLSAVPIPDPNYARNHKRILLEGDVPSPLNMPSGCPFRTRCQRATKECAEIRPELREVAPDHMVACIHV